MSPSNFGQDTDYSDRALSRYLLSLQANFRVVSRSHDSFLPVPFLFITVSAFFNLRATTGLQFLAKFLYHWIPKNSIYQYQPSNAVHAVGQDTRFSK